MFNKFTYDFFEYYHLTYNREYIHMERRIWNCLFEQSVFDKAEVERLELEMLRI